MAAGRARPLVGCKVARLLVFGLAMVVAVSQAPSARAALLVDIPELNDVSPVCSFMALDALGDNNLFLGLGGTEAMMLAYNTVTGTTRTGILAGTSDLVGCSLGENNFAYVVSATGLVTQVDYFDFSEVRSDNSNQQLGTTFGPSTCFSAQDNYFFVLPSPPAPQANERFATGAGNLLSAQGTFNLNQLDAAEVFFNLDSLNRQYAATNGSPGTVVRFNDGITQIGPVTLDPGDDNITAVAYSEVERMAWFATSTTPGKIITFSLTGMTKVGLTYEPEIEGLGPLANGAWNQLNRTAYFTTVVEDVPLLLRFTYDIATQRLTFNGSQALSTSPDVVIFDDVNNAVLLTTPEGVSVVEAASEWLDPADAILSLLGSSEEDDLTTGLGVGAIFGIFVVAVVVILAATAAVFLVMRKRRIANGTDLKSRRASRRITRTASQTELVESGAPPGSGAPVGERFNSTSTNKPSRERLADSIYMGGDAEASWEEFEEGGGGGGGGSGGDVEEAWEDDGEEGWEGDDPNHRPPPQRQAPAPSERSTTMRAKPTRGHGSNAPRPVSRKPTPSRSTPSISTDPSSLRPRDTIGNPGAYDTTTASFPMKQFRAGTEGGGGSPGTPRGTWRPRDTMGDGTGTPRSTFTPRGTVSPADFGATMTMTIDPEKLRQMGDEAVAEFQSIRLPVINDDGWSAPPIVFVCVEWMMAKGLNEEGVFRIPASKTKINALLREFRSGRDNLNDVFDPHEVAGLLKLWVKSEQQLFPSALVPKLTAASEIPNADERKLDCFLQVLSQVPPGRIEVMHILVDLFVAISSNWKVNKMKVSNMAMVIAPTYFSGMRIGSANSTMGFLIKNRDGIFGGPYYE